MKKYIGVALLCLGGLLALLGLMALAREVEYSLYGLWLTLADGVLLSSFLAFAAGALAPALIVTYFGYRLYMAGPKPGGNDEQATADPNLARLVTTKTIIVSVLTLALVLLAWLGRYDAVYMDTAGRTVAVLDRWTGCVSFHMVRSEYVKVINDCRTVQEVKQARTKGEAARFDPSTARPVDSAETNSEQASSVKIAPVDYDPFLDQPEQKDFDSATIGDH